jgi:putative ABC transport system ATP-binding protein
MRREFITMENCYKIYRDKESRVETVALKDINLKVFEGEIIIITGPSGSGKSTLLNIIGGLDVPNAGNVIHHTDDADINISAISDEDRDLFRTRNIGYLQQKPMLISNYSTVENIELPLLTRGIHNPRKKALELVEKFGLEKVSMSKPNQLSGGERQRAALASTLIFNPSLLLADEPTSEVDSVTSSAIIEILKSLNRELGLTLIIVTHDTELTAHGDRHFVLEDGKITKRNILSDQTNFNLKIDKFNRIQLPPEVLEILNQPSVIYCEKLPQLIKILNADYLDKDAYQDEIDNIFVIDKDGRFKIPKEYVDNSYVDLRIDGKLVFCIGGRVDD